jgi:GntR family transcriptional regulator
MADLLQSLKQQWQVGHRGPTARVPLYHRLYTLLKGAILDGTIPYDAQMPTEQQLVSAFSVSRITAKRAMDELAQENLIARFRGRGSHVTYNYTPQPLHAPLVDLLENFADLGKHSKTRVIASEKTVPPADVREILGLDDDETVQMTVRVSAGDDGEPYARYQSWTVGIDKPFTKRELQRSTRLDLLRKRGIQLARMQQFLSAESASVPVAAELNVEPGAALLSIRRLGYSTDEQVVDVLDGLYNPQRFQYAMDTKVA